MVVVLGHPRSESYCGALADAFEGGARESGASVERINLGELDFRSDLREVSPRDQPLEPDLERCKEALEQGDHLVFVFPTWWATMPACLKGFLDRVLLPGFAFRVDEDSPTGYQPLLKGRSAHLITTMDSPSWVYRWLYGRPGDRAMRGGILGFCGIKPVGSTWVTKLKHKSAEERAATIESIRQLGRGVIRERERLLQRKRITAWLRLVRLQFYGMTLLSYGLGAAAVVALRGVAFDWVAFLLGFVALFLLEMGSVFLNEFHDRGTDGKNANRGPFTGGSGVLIEGLIPAEDVQRAARRVLLAALVCFVALAVWTNRGPERMFGVAALLAVGVLLGPGYTAPPMRWVYRGWGEVVVAFTHSIFMVLGGWVFLGGGLGDPRPWVLGLPLFAAIGAAIALAGIPDAEADQKVNKRTLAVRLSPPGAALAALVAVLGAVALIPVVARVIDGGWELFGRAFPWLAAHALILCVLVVRYLRNGAGCRRIDAILFVSLTFIFWFSIPPLLALLEWASGV